MIADRIVPLAIRVPAWARFVAQDGRGYWRAFEYEPAAVEERWLSPGPVKLLARGVPTRHWRRTLRVLPTISWQPAAKRLARVAPSRAGAGLHTTPRRLARKPRKGA